MHYVYFIKSKGCNFQYIGSTDDLKNRLSEHNRGDGLSTKPYAPFELVYYEAYSDKNDALDREKALKHHGSVIGHLKKRLKNSLKCEKSVKRVVGA
jgi:putative endonuclease